MRLELTGRHIDITDGIRRIVETKLAKLERLLKDAGVSAQVVATRDKSGHRADVTLHARGEKFMHADGRGESLATAMAQAVDRLGQQVRKVKGKFEGRRRLGAKDAPVPIEVADPEPRRVAPRAARARMPRILKARRQVIRTMSVSDAAAQIDGGEGAVVFLDVETSRIAVLYRAPGGDLTLIETKA
ncbi:MAG TPA: ribosome-associated translation inhibitor RaiA [Vicinamibacterales bacterium]|nr:ribosome-associated translation inhibitor RaiA [Vicinamibacterales bacterium]